MKNLALLIIGALALTSCTKEGTGMIDPELQDYIIRFENDLGITLPSDLTATIVNDLTVANFRSKGYAHGMNKKHVHIEVDAEYWEDMDEMARTLLIYHELGHDVFNLKHDDSDLNLMRPGYPAWVLNGGSKYTYGDRQSVLDRFIEEYKSF